MEYGIRIVQINWACKDGGDDYIGTEQEMKSIIKDWTEYPDVRYDVIPYTSVDGSPPPFPNK